MYLLTWHGTIVCRGDSSGPLRHLALPLPRGATPLMLAGMATAIDNADLGSVRLVQSGYGHALNILRGGFFMCAEMPSGRIVFDRTEAAGWETFLPMTPEAFRDLRHILGHHWIVADTREVIRRRAIGLQEKLRLRIGTLAVRLASLTDPIVAGRDADGMPAVLRVPHEARTIELAIAGTHGSVLLRTAPRGGAARQLGEAIALALHRQVAGSEPEQDVFERDAAMVESMGVLAGIEAVLDRITPQHVEQPDEESTVEAGSARDPSEALQEAIAQFAAARPARIAGEAGQDAPGVLLTLANESLLRFAGLSGLQRPCRFGLYNRAAQGVETHGETALVEIANGAVTIRMADDERLTWHLLERALPLLALLDRVLDSGTVGHAAFLAEIGDDGFLPCVAYSSRSDKACLIPDSDFIATGGYAGFRALARVHAVSWETRSRQVFWRGSSTGVRRKAPPATAEDDDFTWLPRLDLCRRARDSANAAFYDVGIANITQIPEPDLVQRIHRAGLCKPPADRATLLGQKAIIVIDGNSNAWSALFCALLSGACVLLVQSPRGHRQWYYDRLEPWLHYVPVSADLRDLDRVVSWVLENDDDARSVGETGRAFAEELTFEAAMEDGVGRLRGWIGKTTGVPV